MRQHPTKEEYCFLLKQHVLSREPCGQKINFTFKELCHATSLLFLLCDSHKICLIIIIFRCEQAWNSRQIYDQVEHNVHWKIDSNTAVPQQHRRE